VELRHLRYFVAIADGGTMAKAADRVHVTQSTLSHQLAQLEAEVGTALFERTGRALHLSDAGRVWLGYARGILAQVDEAKDALTRTRKLETGEVRIGVIHSFVTKLMPDIAAGFVKRHPGIRLQVHEMSGVEIESQVEAGTLDLGFAFHPPAHAGVTGERLFDDTLVLAVHARHALAGRRSVRFAELAGVPLALLTERFATRRLLDAHFQRAGVTPRVVIEIDSVDALERIAALGVGCHVPPAPDHPAEARQHPASTDRGHGSPPRARGRTGVAKNRLPVRRSLGVRRVPQDRPENRGADVSGSGRSQSLGLGRRSRAFRSRRTSSRPYCASSWRSAIARQPRLISCPGRGIPRG
jgi:LysR family transcriptional regulator, cyn operon transcriptional activator